MVIVSGTWSTTDVNALLAGLIGVAATLLGSFTTYLFQSRTAERAQSFERDERLRYEQVNACSAFASAMTELKRGLITLRFYYQRDAAGADYAAARIECDRLGASAEAARFRVQLVSGDREVEMPHSLRSAPSAALLTGMNCANARTTSKRPSLCSFTLPLDAFARPLQHRRQADLAKMHQRPLHSSMRPRTRVLVTHRVHRHEGARRTSPPYLHPPVTASVRFGVSAVMVTLVWGWLSLLPVPDSCRVLRAGGRVKGRAAPACGAAGALDAAVRERIMQGGRGRESLVVRDAVQRFRRAAFLCGVTSSGGRGRGPGAASLT